MDDGTPVCVHHGGREFLASPVMAGIFLRRAEIVIQEGETQLVPLLHQGGVDLLLIGVNIQFSVHETFAATLLAG